MLFFRLIKKHRPRYNMDASPIYLFELFGLHNWLQLGNRFNPEIKDATEWDKKDE